VLEHFLLHVVAERNSGRKSKVDESHPDFHPLVELILGYGNQLIASLGLG
jgi:hypothetical protein